MSSYFLDAKNYYVYMIIFLASSDLVQLFGVRLLYPFVFLLLAFFLSFSKNIMINYREFYLIVSLVFSSYFSLFFSSASNFVYSFFYIQYFFLNFILFIVCYNLFVEKKDFIINVFIKIFRAIGVGALVIYLSGFQDRLHFLFYESSYLSFYVVFYLSIVLFKSFYNKKIDIFLIIFLLFFSKSVFVFVGVFSVSAFYFIKNFSIKNSLYVVIFSIVLSSLIMFIQDDLLVSRIVQVFDKDSSFFDALSLGGNRLNRFLLGYYVYLDHYFFGVGAGGFEQFSVLNQNTYSQFQNLPDYTSPYGYPVVNAFLELLVTFGFIPAAIFIFYILYLLTSKKVEFYIKVILFSYIMLLFFESSIFRPYVWLVISLAAASRDSYVVGRR